MLSSQVVSRCLTGLCKNLGLTLVAVLASPEEGHVADPRLATSDLPPAVTSIPSFKGKSSGSDV